jgi:Kef-type K+ transport system membrane component KefB/Trk K+ transport system NAD-binding subunit
MNFLVEAEETFNFFPLLIVFLLAIFVPIITSRIKAVPVVVGEILAGILVGRSVLGWVQEDSILALIADIGLAFLMFLAGMEIDFDPILGKKDGKANDSPNLLRFSSWVYILTAFLAGGGAFLLYQMGMEGDPWLIAFILSATSLGVLLPVLRERRLTRTRFGQSVFLTATLADFLTVILLTVYLIIQAQGMDPEIFSISLLFLSFFIAYRLGTRFSRLNKVRRLVEELSRATVQIKVRGAIGILLFFVVLAGFVNAELILGAFLAGMVISLVKSPQDDGLVHNLEAFGFGFFIPVFFIMVGVNLDLRSLWESPQALLLLPALLLISIVVKIIPFSLFKRYLSWREVLAGGALLNTHLSLEIAVAIVGARTGLLSPATTTAVTLFAILTVMFMPVIFGSIAPASEKSKKRIIAICGAGPEALGVAQELKAHGEAVLVINENHEFIQQAQQSGFESVLMEGEDMIGGLDPGSLKAILALCLDDDTNMALCRAADSAGIKPIVARVNDPARLTEFRRMGVQPFIPTLSHTVLLALMVRNPDVYNLLTSVTDDRDVREVVLSNPDLSGRLLRALNLPGEILVLSISRNEEYIIPHGNIELKFGDRLALLGCPDELDDASDLFSR